MDPKERTLIAGLLDRVRALEFEENHVLGLLILLRRHAIKTAPLVAELGDFMAHREKDRGLLLRFLQQVQQALLPGGRAPEYFDTPVSVPVLHDQFTALLKELRLPPITFEHTECLAVVSATLLHQVAFSVPGNRPWQLQFGFNAQLVGLFGVVPLPAVSVTFPVMAVRNRFFSSPFSDSDTYWFPSGHLTVSSACHNGSVGVAQSPAV